MTKLPLFTASMLALAFGTVQAQSDANPRPPLDQAIESVDKNLAKHPDNEGLQNARQRLEDNQSRFEDRRMDRVERTAERADRSQRPERAGRR